LMQEVVKLFDTGIGIPVSFISKSLSHLLRNEE